MWNELPVQVRCMVQGSWGWCTGMTQRDGIGREMGGGFRMGNTCTLMADSCQWMAKPIQSCKVKTNKQQQQQNTLEGINIRIYEAEEWISELEEKTVEITSEEQNKVKRIKRTEDSLRDLWDNIKCTNIWIIGVWEEGKKKGYEKIFEDIIV